MTQTLSEISPRPQLLEARRLTKPGSEGSRSHGIGLALSWSEGTSAELSSELLRRTCPCASCQESRGDTSHARPLDAMKTTPEAGKGRSLLKVIKSDLNTETDLQELWPIGNYAIGMRWGDRHDTGIYSYDVLWQLCSAAREAQEKTAGACAKAAPAK